MLSYFLLCSLERIQHGIYMGRFINSLQKQRWLVNRAKQKTTIMDKYINPFHVTGLFLYLLKTLENLWFSDIFRGCRNGPVAWNGW